MRMTLYKSYFLWVSVSSSMKWGHWAKLYLRSWYAFCGSYSFVCVSFSKCSTTTLFKVYFLVLFFFFFLPSLSLSSIYGIGGHWLSLRGGRRKKVSYRKGLYPSLQENLNIATTALKGMVYVQTAFSRQALYFFANRINFKLNAVDS